MKYGELGNKKLYEFYAVDTDDGLLSTCKMESMVKQEMAFRRMGVKNICPRCGAECAMLLGDPDGEHWCLGCQVLADPEGVK
jgi:hypothetical protein